MCYNRSPKTKLIIVAPHLGAHTDPLVVYFHMRASKILPPKCLRIGLGTIKNIKKVHIETVWKTIEFCILGNDIHSKKKKFKFFILI